MDVLTSTYGVLSFSSVEAFGIVVLVCGLGFTGAPLWLWTALSAAVLWTFGAPGGLWLGLRRHRAALQPPAAPPHTDLLLDPQSP